MAQEKTATPAKSTWTKLFLAFKIALDLKKLVLAGAGIFLTAVGWSAVGWTFYGMREFPEWVKYDNDKNDRISRWNYFKAKRASWNLIHELAGRPGDEKPVDAGDIAGSPEEFAVLHEWEQKYRRGNEEILLSKENVLKVRNIGEFKLSPKVDANLAKFKKTLVVRDIDKIVLSKAGDAKAERTLRIAGVDFKVDEGPLEKLAEYREGAISENEIIHLNGLHGQTFRSNLVQPRIKPAGRLMVWPWSENRGENPYLLVTDVVREKGTLNLSAGSFLGWVCEVQAPVLLEPLYKFLIPMQYLFHKDASSWDRLYLIFLILWTLAVWGFFGGAISRIAALQFARNERISLRDAIKFTRERFVSYVAAPVLPLVLLLVFTIALMVLGWIHWIPILGEIVAVLVWPVVLLVGFIMAVVIVGLIGWPLMVATISTEGTDSFDALSRSYSYVYTAPWRYLWYSVVSVFYGAAMVFFVGLMASLMVFMGKWGVSSAVGPADVNPEKDREPSYLFASAPTSLGWRDLLISNSLHVNATTEKVGGRTIKHFEFDKQYTDTLKPHHKIFGVLMCIWIYPLFLIVLGFSYSFFWTASTIIYFLIRRDVDDTELDEVQQEDEDLDDPFLKAPATPSAAVPAAAPAPAPERPGAISLNVVEPPPPAPIKPEPASDAPPGPPSPPAPPSA